MSSSASFRGSCSALCATHDETEKRRDLKKTVFIYRFSSATARSSALAFASHPPSCSLLLHNKFHVRTCYPFSEKRWPEPYVYQRRIEMNTTKVFVAQNFLVFPETCRGAGCGVDVGRSSDDVVYCEPTNPPHAGAVDALKWSLGRKTYIEKTLFGGG